MSKTNKYQSVREVELSRKLARLWEQLPFGVAKALLFEFGRFLQDPEENQKPYEIQVEAPADRGNKKGRFDVLIPLSLFDKYERVVFETKLFDEDLNQLREYADNQQKDLIISLARSVSRKDVCVDNLVRLSWTQFAFALSSLLGIDAQTRLNMTEYSKQRALSEVKELSPTYPPGYIGASVESVLESFLFDISQQGLVQFGERVMAATGDFATNLCKDQNIYLYPDSWDHNFQYLCIIYQKNVQYLGKVVNRVNNIDIGEGQVDHPEVSKDLVQKIYSSEKGGHSGTVLELKPLIVRRNKELIIDESISAIPESYLGTGAFTQSHRYFESLEDLYKALKA